MNIDELKTRLVNEWAQFDQSIIDAASSRARGAHFEHKFWQKQICLVFFETRCSIYVWAVNVNL